MRSVLAKKSLDSATSELVNWYLETEFGSEEAANLDDISLSGYWNSEDSFSGGYRLFPNSYAELAIKYAEGLPIRLNCIVEKIDYDEAIVTVKCKDNSYGADKIIVTLPLGVLKNDSVQFTPELPIAKREAINSLSMGLANKVILRFPKVFWPAKTDYFGYIEEYYFATYPIKEIDFKVESLKPYIEKALYSLLKNDKVGKVASE